MKKNLLSICLTASVALSPIALLGQAPARTNPKIVSQPSPGYPAELVDTGISGKAELDVVIKADGTTADAQVMLSNNRAFSRSALEAIRVWKFEPATVDGKAVDAKVTIPFNFTAPLEQWINFKTGRKVFVAVTDPILTDKDFPAKKLKAKNVARMEPLRGVAPTGKISVKVVVGPDGKVLNPAIVTPGKQDVDDNALVTAAKMTFEPPMKDGKPVYVETTLALEWLEFGGGRGDGGDFGGRGGGGGGRGGGGGGGGRG